MAFVCRECGHQSGRWLGRCPGCGQWECMVEEEVVGAGRSRSHEYVEPQPLTMAPDGDHQRIVIGVSELDRVLGGGIVPGSVILIGGDPGIGKSTLLLQLLSALAARGHQVLYVSGEESAHQIKSRAKRLSAVHERHLLATETAVERIAAMTTAIRPMVVAIDSIQTLTCADYPSSPGSVTQVRESASYLLDLAKKENIPMILVGHVTKEGTLAGPRVLEHMVDTVLYFEGDRSHAFRILRTVKNRFGSTNEIGVFSMKEEGLVPVANPSELFLAERPLDVAGSVVLATMEGTRPILVEVQALVSPTNLGTARRTAAGADPKRLALLCAVLEKKAGLDFYGHDIFLNIAGGMQIDEPALDLGVIGALASSLLERPVAADTVLAGEIGLAGEIRAVGHMEQRVAEAERLGFKHFIMPKTNADRLAAGSTNIRVMGVATVDEFLKVIASSL
ncbi:MAG: DNA repair protein RadA [Desulfofustis sp.]|nr:DNA repair protein RadA [Desulfofustis limnaeus]MDX9895210.1 DNA repair protein RadA [Desulfofustis sp.]